MFDFKEDINVITIDLTHAHFWDISAVEALDKVTSKFKKNDISVKIVGLNEASATIISKIMGKAIDYSATK